MPSLRRGLFDEFGGAAGAGGANQQAPPIAVSGEKSSLGARTPAAASNAAIDAESSACDASAGLRALPGAAAPAPPAHASAARPPDRNVCRKAMRWRIEPVAAPVRAVDEEDTADETAAVVDALLPTLKRSSSKSRPPMGATAGAAAPFGGAAPPKFNSEPKIPRFFEPAPSSAREMGDCRESDGDDHLYHIEGGGGAGRGGR